ncbi:MAG: hypothetical protein KBC69_03810 [Candidatus Magasanikbacteria bacterium]|nr:hypothetical protein [Candidatus Magasanikbacteria bacterium]
MKKNLSLLASFGTLLILAGAGCAAKNTTTTNVQTEKETTTENRVMDNEEEVVENKSTENTGNTTETKPATEVKTATSFTLADVAKHNTPESCYIIVNSSVYDVTKFTDKHPGGSDKIIPLCGKDATAPFTQVHGGQQKPADVLVGLQIGVLQK